MHYFFLFSLFIFNQSVLGHNRIDDLCLMAELQDMKNELSYMNHKDNNSMGNVIAYVNIQHTKKRTKLIESYTKNKISKESYCNQSWKIENEEAKEIMNILKQYYKVKKP